MPQPAYTRTAIMQLLREHGPMTAAQITEAMHMSRQAIDAAITGARAKYGTEFFVIVGYHNQRGTGGREAPMYGPGPGEDAKRPLFGKRTVRAADARYREKHRAVIRLKTTQRRHGAVNPFAGLVKP